MTGPFGGGTSSEDLVAALAAAEKKLERVRELIANYDADHNAEFLGGSVADDLRAALLSQVKL